MYIGIYGGTFNPIHFGHLRAAEEICQRFKMKEVLFVPASVPPHKDGSDIVDPIHRLKMVNLAITGNERFKLSEVEVHRPGKSYSIDTVKALKQSYPDDSLAFIMGLDAFLEIHTWHKYEQIFSECDFIVTTRPGARKTTNAKAMPEKMAEEFKKKDRGTRFEHVSGKSVIFTEVTDLDISATRIRKIAREGGSIRYLLPRRVIDYLCENGLYK